MGHIFSMPLKKLPSKDMGDMATEAVFTDAAAAPIILYLTGATHLNNRLFTLKAWGRVTGGTTGNFTLALQYGTSATFTSNTDVFTSTARAVNSESGSWSFIAQFVWDSTSDKLQAIALVVRINDITINAPTVGVEITGIDPNDNSSSRGFVMTGLHSATNAGNHAWLDGFELEID